MRAVRVAALNGGADVSHQFVHSLDGSRQISDSPGPPFAPQSSSCELQLAV
jgi:hypothetical protein